MEGLIPGRIVHVTDGYGGHQAAIINAVGEDETLDVTVFRPGTGEPHGLQGVLRDVGDPDDTAPTWHWIERA